MQLGNNKDAIYCLSKRQFSITSSLLGCDLIEKNIIHYMNVIFPPKIYVDIPDTGVHSLLTQLRIEIKDNFCPGNNEKEAFFVVVFLNLNYHLKRLSRT